MHRLVYILYPLSEIHSKTIPVVIRITGSQILVSKYFRPIKETRALGGMVDSRAEAGKIPDHPGISFGTRKKRNARK